MDSLSQLEHGREAYRRRAWSDAFTALSAADRAGTLTADDLWLLAMAAFLTGREDAFLETLERAHHRHLEEGSSRRAASCAFWLGMQLAESGAIGRASGWMGRATRLIEREDADCVERGYLLLASSRQQLVGGDFEAAFRVAGDAAKVGQGFGDVDLLALALHLQGIALLSQTRIEEGLALLDEAMVAVATDELSPQVTGLIYCSAIGACRRFHALSRAHEWTAALFAWCEQQPDLIAYSGECMVYRSEILQLHGAWTAALEEARRACERFEQSAAPQAAGAALYRQGELHRLRGDLAAAEAAYRDARQAGHGAQPGLALLRLAQHKSDAAAAGIRRALAEIGDPLRRTALLPAHIEIMLAIGERDEARSACRELEQTGEIYRTALLTTLVAHARGAIELAEGGATAALVPLREAWHGWQTMDAPYEAARVRVLLALACRSLGDTESAALELEVARAAFERLGAGPDAARVASLQGSNATHRPHGLTPRELEVLASVATGRTNREIAGELFISEKTVARHVSNIFMKLGLSSRAAATAFAYEHDLLDPSA